MGRLQQLGAGWGTWRYLSGATAKEKSWLLGVIQNRAGYGAWITHLARGLGDKDFLLAFESESDPWGRSKIVGQKIHELRLSFRKLTDGQRAELAAQAESELRIGLAQLIKDKTTLKSLIDCVDPPAAPVPAQ
jgi:hypothetical protein